ncbi:MAG: hypothetical protein ACK6BQ_16075 [Bacteroidota bacterium]
MENQGSKGFFEPHQSYFANRKDKRLVLSHQIIFDVDISDGHTLYIKKYSSL